MSGNVTIDSGSVCRSFDTISGTGSYGGTITHTSSVTWTIGDGTAGAGNVALKFNSGITYTLGSVSTSAISFVSTSATQQTITSAGKSLGNFTINGASSSYLLSDAMTIASTALVTLTAGTFDTNGVACAWGSFSTPGAVTRALTLGASTITMNGNITNNWSVSGSNITINANTSSIITTTNAGSGSTLFTGGNGFTYYIVSFTGSGEVRMGGASTYNTITRTGTADKTNSFRISSSLTVTGTLNLNGNSATNRLLVFATTLGTAQTITNSGATMNLTNVDFRDITLGTAYDASAITGLSGDCGGNSGITFTTAENQAWSGLNGSYYRNPGVTTNYASSPDSSAVSITGDIDIQVRVSADDWTPSSEKDIFSKYGAAGQRSWDLAVTSGGNLKIYGSADGTSTVNATSSVATGHTDGTAYWIRATWVDSTNTVQFFTAVDSEALPTWVQLGTDQTLSLAGIFDSTANLEIGGINGGNTGLIGKYYRSRLLNGVGGTVVFDAIFSSATAGASTFTESSSNAATVTINTTGGSWSASRWSSRVPLPQDNVYMGGTFSASQTVTADMPRIGKSIDWTGATNTPTWSTNTIAQTLYGSLTLVSGMTFTSGSTGSWTFEGRGSFTLTSAGKSFAGSFNIAMVGGTLTLQDAFSQTAGAVTLSNGTFNANNFNVTTTQFTTNVSGTRIVTMGSGTWTVTSTGVVWHTGTTSGQTINANTSTIFLSNTSSTGKTLTGATITLYDLKIAGGGSGTVTLIGANSFNSIYTDGGGTKSIVLPGSTTTTIRSTTNTRLNNGTNLITFTASSGSATVSHPTGSNIVWDYVSLTNIIASTTGAKYYAGPTTHSTNGGGNTNWIFGNPGDMLLIL